jgi:hypothetical protein
VVKSLFFPCFASSPLPFFNFAVIFLFYDYQVCALPLGAQGIGAESPQELH